MFSQIRELTAGASSENPQMQKELLLACVAIFA